MTTTQPRKPGSRRALVIFLSALAILGVGIIVAMTSGGDDAPVRPGHPSVYSRIDAETDCAALQREFDTADANHTRDISRGRSDLAEVDTSYMQAAQDRMQQLGC